MKERYVTEPHHALQRKCAHPHKMRNRRGDECSLCGGVKTKAGVWRHLNKAWLKYYIDGGPRPT